MTFLFIFMLFSEYREEEFQQRQKEKILTTLKFLTDVKEMNESIAHAMDRITIHDFYDEKMLIYNNEKKLIYSSIDDLPISISQSILDRLSADNKWIETKEEEYDVIGIHVMSGDGAFYGISKAYDEFGFTKLEYLKLVLIISFIAIAIALFFTTNYLANSLSKPIRLVAQKIKEYDFEKELEPLDIESTKGEEIDALAKRFNELMLRTNKAFAFQKHAINHISHELKTPISILVSNFDKMEGETDIKKLKEQIQQQKRGTKSLANIINTLLEIAKVESGKKLPKSKIRIDELIFDIAEELQIIYPDFLFKINYEIDADKNHQLLINANKQLLKSAFSNLMLNSIQYNSIQSADIILKAEGEDLTIAVTNQGELLKESEIPFLFDHFFRGKNSKGKSGFGLGLVLVKKIIELHRGDVNYLHQTNENTFIVKLPINQSPIIISG